MPKKETYKIISPYIKFSGDLFAFVAIKNSELDSLDKIERRLNKESKCEGSHLMPICECFDDINLDSVWQENGFTLFIHVLMWG